MPRLTVEQLEALRQIDSPTVSNAIEHFGVRLAERDVLDLVRRPGLTVEQLRAFQERFRH